MLSFEEWLAEHDEELHAEYTEVLRDIAHAREWDNSYAEACSFMQFARGQYEAEKEDEAEGAK